MANITLGGNPVNTVGELPKIGEAAPDFLLTKTDLSDLALQDVSGKKSGLKHLPQCGYTGLLGLGAQVQFGNKQIPQRLSPVRVS